VQRAQQLPLDDGPGGERRGAAAIAGWAGHG
jgi:hypothetical protein